MTIFYFFIFLYGFSRYYGLYIIDQFFSDINLTQIVFTYNGINPHMKNIDNLKKTLYDLQILLVFPIVGTINFISLYILYKAFFKLKTNKINNKKI